MKDKVSQSSLIYDYYKNHPNQDIAHSEAVDWATGEWLRITGKVLRDPDRAIRAMFQNGKLIKVTKGVYRYDPEHIEARDLEDFTLEQKAQILRRDNFKCVMCGKGIEDGVELQVDHIKAKDLGGKADIANGQTLCAQHNFMKKNYGQTEVGKKMFIRLYEKSKKQEDLSMMNFCIDILNLYKENGIDSHIYWSE